MPSVGRSGRRSSRSSGCPSSGPPPPPPPPQTTTSPSPTSSWPPWPLSVLSERIICSREISDGLSVFIDCYAGLNFQFSIEIWTLYTLSLLDIKKGKRDIFQSKIWIIIISYYFLEILQKKRKFQGASKTTMIKS